MNALAPMPHDTENPGHAPVMLAEVLAELAPRSQGRYLDGTFGGGGYARAILATADCQLWGIDRDPDAITRGHEQSDTLLAREGRRRLHLLPGTFGEMATLAEDIAPFDGIVLDLGVSSFQLDQAERGFSFKQHGPLDMRMARSGPSAADLVNKASEEELADIIYHYGEDRLARRIARAIVQARGEEAILTTGRLASVIRRVVPQDRSGIDPATRSFQGLRIAVNDELGQIERALADAPRLLAPGGVFVVVSFHSLEDRLVKRAMAHEAGRTARPSRHTPGAIDPSVNRSEFALATPKPLRATQAETQANPRARSAKLRALSRLSSSASPGIAR